MAKCPRAINLRDGYSIPGEPAMLDLLDSASNLHAALLRQEFSARDLLSGKAYVYTIRDQGKCFPQVRLLSVIAHGWKPQSSR